MEVEKVTTFIVIYKGFVEEVKVFRNHSDAEDYYKKKVLKSYESIEQYEEEEPKPLEKKKELIFEKYLDSKIDKPLIKCLYTLSKENDESVLDKKGAIEAAQEYANRGFEILCDTVTKGHDMVISLTEFLMENYLDNKT